MEDAAFVLLLGSPSSLSRGTCSLLVFKEKNIFHLSHWAVMRWVLQGCPSHQHDMGSVAPAPGVTHWVWGAALGQLQSILPALCLLSFHFLSYFCGCAPLIFFVASVFRLLAM